MNLIKDFRAETYRILKEEGPDAFFAWLHHQQGEDDAFRVGERDLQGSILRGLPAGHELKGTALEIGYGRGRLAAAAASRFDRVVGADIRNCDAVVASALRRHGTENVELRVYVGKALPGPDASWPRSQTRRFSRVESRKREQTSQHLVERRPQVAFQLLCFRDLASDGRGGTSE